MSRLAFLEAQMDREDLSENEFDTLNKELVAIYKQQDERKAMFEMRRKEEQEEIELAKVLSLTEEQVDQMYQDSCLKYQDVNGMSFKAWYEQSLKYYTIDEKNNVHSKARSADTVEIVPNPTHAQAKLLILKRIRYKFYDHAVRGHDFAYELDGGDNAQYISDELIDLFIDTWNAHNKEDMFRGKLRRERLNYGWCYQFAYLVKKLHGDIAELHFDYGHAWVKIGDKVYDSDQPQGVDSPEKFMCGPRFPDATKSNVSLHEFMNFWSTGGTGPIQVDVIDKVLVKYRMRHIGA